MSSRYSIVGREQHHTSIINILSENIFNNLMLVTLQKVVFKYVYINSKYIMYLLKNRNLNYIYIYNSNLLSLYIYL